MVVGVTVAGVTVITLTITITAEILTAHCVHTMYYHKRLRVSQSLHNPAIYLYVIISFHKYGNMGSATQGYIA